MTAIQKTNGWLDLLRDGSSGANNPQITYVALGTGTTAPAITDTQLVTEVFRKAVTSYTNGGSHGEILINMYLGPNDAVGDNIQEVGFFGGGSATSTINTGILVARGLWAHNPKTNLESIVFQIDATIS